MKHAALAIACAFAASAALAQAPAPAPAAPATEAIKPKCDPKPEYPGRLAMTVETKRKNFERDMKNYETCMKAFLEERKNAIKANELAANAAIEEYNATMKKIREEQEAARQ